MNSLFKAGLLDHLLDPVISTDSKFHIKGWNRAAEQVYGWQASEVMGQQLPNVLSTRYTHVSREEMLQTFQEAGEWRGEVEQQTKSGKWLPVLSSVVILKGEQDESVGVVAVNRVIHDLKETQLELEARVKDRTAQLEAAVRELETFSYSVSHDLRAPLRSVSGFARILQDDFDLPDNVQPLLRRIIASAHHMGELIDGLLAFSRLNKLSLNKSAVDAAAVARSAFQSLEGVPRNDRLNLSIEPMPNCCADVLLLERVYANLLSNALKFTRREAQACISVGCLEGDEPVYFVRDNGVGFDMTYVDKLFGVFQQLHSKKDFEGTGVGLATVQRIVHRHGGRVWADSQKGEGTSFYFTFPQERSGDETTYV